MSAACRRHHPPHPWHDAARPGDRPLAHFHPGQRSENNGNPPYRNAHPIVERMGRSHHASPHPVRAGPVLVSRNFRVLATHSPAARPAPAYLHPVRSHLRTPNRRYVGYVGNIHSLIIESASTSRACVPRHWHFYNRLGHLIGGRRLTVTEQPRTRLATRTLGLAAAPALGEWRSLTPAAPVGLRELPPQLLVGPPSTRRSALEAA